ncbi:sulfite exporter TauE/SafE family protein [Leeia sp. TBRC 13508]|uniref:Probable membrane transporter protein n=1 Tax=Leeia speluncae TaxID=2884804 RepID=A0ABS8DAS0_9NEIS|nr:sulfite exporter TauE/SafE family protein [Leeia speluncae]MCB6185310.1 sulfite exporter TauE/SafE family protein [Leeia speluncae]
MDFIHIASGFIVGLIVGVTGVGGGSLMTPILLALGVPTVKAVGTDLLYAAITKAAGVFVHQKQRNINWKMTFWLSVGSIPASLLTLYALKSWDLPEKTIDSIIKQALGIALFLTAVSILSKSWILKKLKKDKADLYEVLTTQQKFFTVCSGLLLGVLVTLSSVGAGAVGTILLFVLFPSLPTVKLVGTEIAHAVPLTLIAGLGHAGLGNLNWELLFTLLTGSIPGILIGSRLSGTMPDHIIRPILAVILGIVGFRFII